MGVWELAPSRRELWRWEGAAREVHCGQGSVLGTGQAGGSPIAGARKPALDVLQEEPELKRAHLKAKKGLYSRDTVKGRLTETA